MTFHYTTGLLACYECTSSSPLKFHYMYIYIYICVPGLFEFVVTDTSEPSGGSLEGHEHRFSHMQSLKQCCQNVGSLCRNRNTIVEEGQ